MKLLYAFFKASLITFYLGIFSPFTLKAQTVTQSWAVLASGAGPRGIAIDASGNVYTANQSNNTVSKITPAGVVTQSWATLASGALPTAIVVDASGNVYTANYGNNTVSKITSAGVVTKSWAALASGANPKSIAITSGILYTANLSNNTVSKVTSSVLPVELVSFSGKNTEGVNWLSWETAQEEKVLDFEIERSNDGLMFSKIGISKANSNPSVYEFIDHKPSNGLNYYRLKINGIDGQSEYSKVIALSNARTNQVKIYPSVTKGELTIEGAKSFEVVNAIGQIQKVQNEGVGSIQGTQHLNLDLPTGLYIIRGLDTEGVHFSQKIVKQ